MRWLTGNPDVSPWGLHRGDVGAQSCSQRERDRASSPRSLRGGYFRPCVDRLAAVDPGFLMAAFPSPNEAAPVAMETRAASISAGCRVRRADVLGGTAATAVFPCAATRILLLWRLPDAGPRRPRSLWGPAARGPDQEACLAQRTVLARKREAGAQTKPHRTRCDGHGAASWLCRRAAAPQHGDAAPRAPRTAPAPCACCGRRVPSQGQLSVPGGRSWVTGTQPRGSH